MTPKHLLLPEDSQRHPPISGSPWETQTKCALPVCVAQWNFVQHLAWCVNSASVGCIEYLCLEIPIKQIYLKEINLIDMH